MIINTTISGTAPAGFATAVAAAVSYFETTLTNNATVNLTFAFSSLGKSGPVAQTEYGANLYTVDYASWRNAMLANAQGPGATADNQTAAASLPATNPFPQNNVQISWQLAQAIGLSIPFVTSDPVAVDATITLNSQYGFTFDPANRAVSGKFDAIGTLEHEISEALGRDAGSDGTSNATGSASSSLGLATPLDFFRYSNVGHIDLSSSYSGAFFSLDGSNLLIAMGESQSDLADWASSVSGDAAGYAQTGVQSNFTAVDLQAMSAIGWHVASNAELYVTVYHDTFHAAGAAVHVSSGVNGDVVTGDGNTIDIAAGAAIQITGSHEVVTVNGDYAQAALTGGSESVTVNATNNSITIGGGGTGAANADTVTFATSGSVDVGDNANVTLNGAQATISTGANDIVTVNTALGGLAIHGANTVATVGGQVTVSFGAAGSTVNVRDGAHLSISCNRDTINAGSNDILDITNLSSWVGDTVNVSGSGTQVKVGNYRTFNTPITVLFAAGGTVNLYDGSLVAVTGDNVTAQLGSNDGVSLTGGAASIAATGTGDSITVGGNGAGAAVADVVTLAQGGTVQVADKTRVDIYGNGAVITLGAGDEAGIQGSSIAVATSGAGSEIWIGGNGALAAVADTVALAQGGSVHVGDASRVDVFGDGAVTVVGTGDEVGVQGSAATVYVTGTGSEVWIGPNGALAPVADSVILSHGASVHMADGARVDVYGDHALVLAGTGDEIGLRGSAATVAVSGTGSEVWIGGNGELAAVADAVSLAQGGHVHVADASRVDVYGNGAAVFMGASDMIGLAGNNDAINFGTAIGHAMVWAANPSDHFTLSQSSFAGVGGGPGTSFDYWAYLLGHATVAGGDTTITIDNTDSIVLKGFALSAGSQSQFSFA